MLLTKPRIKATHYLPNIKNSMFFIRIIPVVFKLVRHLERNSSRALTFSGSVVLFIKMAKFNLLATFVILTIKHIMP